MNGLAGQGLAHTINFRKEQEGILLMMRATLTLTLTQNLLKRCLIGFSSFFSSSLPKILPAWTAVTQCLHGQGFEGNSLPLTLKLFKSILQNLPDQFNFLLFMYLDLSLTIRVLLRINYILLHFIRPLKITPGHNRMEITNQRDTGKCFLQSNTLGQKIHIIFKIYKEFLFLMHFSIFLFHFLFSKIG